MQLLYLPLNIWRYILAPITLVWLCVILNFLSFKESCIFLCHDQFTHIKTSLVFQFAYIKTVLPLKILIIFVNDIDYYDE